MAPTLRNTALATEGRGTGVSVPGSHQMVLKYSSFLSNDKRINYCFYF